MDGRHTLGQKGVSHMRYVKWLIYGSLLATRAFAQDCTTPPYGDTPQAFKAYVLDTMPIVTRVGPDLRPSRVLPMLCKAKFDGVGREPLYNLGFTPDDFASKSVTALAIQWLQAIKNLADSMPGQ